MESCHECAELIEKLNKEFETLLNEKDLYKSKLKEKNDLVIEMIKNEYLKLNEIRGKKDRLNRVDDNIVKEYNTLSFQENNIQKFIIELCGCI
tara:strand:- start:95 stop:373 length:279 start_codon:yes stop_codon:yes gene_type:complete